MDRVIAAALTAVAFATVAFGAMRLALGSILGLQESMLLNGLALSAFFAGRGLAASLTGVLYDTSPGLAKRLPGIALAGIAATVYAMSYAPPPLLVLLSGLQGLFSGMTWPLVQTSVASHSRGSPLVVSIYFALGSVGVAAGRLAYPTIASMLGDRGVFAFSAALYSAAAASLSTGLGDLKLGSRGGRASAHASRLPRAWKALLLNAASGFNTGLDAQVLYPLLVEAGLGRAAAAYMLSLGAMLGIPAKVLAGGAAERMGLKPVLAVIAASSMAGLTGILVLRGYAAGAAAAAYLASSAAVVPLARLAAYREGERLGSPASVVGVSNTFSNIGSAVAPTLLPLLHGMLPLYAAPLLAASLLAPDSGKGGRVRGSAGVKAACARNRREQPARLPDGGDASP